LMGLFVEVVGAEKGVRHAAVLPQVGCCKLGTSARRSKRSGTPWRDTVGT
jgi:hypothetical protein